jgi:SAM-dependent methyltransferase
MDGYGAGIVELYDQIVDEREDRPFYVNLATDADGPVLELACGTGRIYLDLLRAGVDADGIDLSEDALDVLRENAAERSSTSSHSTSSRENVADAGLDPSVRRGDLTSFSTDREYDLVICPFNAIQHARTVEAQRSCLQSVYDALAPGGRFAFDVFVPNFELICEGYGSWDADEVQFRGETHELRTRTRIVDEVEQEILVENELYDPDGEQVFADQNRLKLLPKRELELLARLSPFESWGVTGGFERPTPAPGGHDSIDDGNGIQLWALRKDV